MPGTKLDPNRQPAAAVDKLHAGHGVDSHPDLLENGPATAAARRSKSPPAGPTSNALPNIDTQDLPTLSQYLAGTGSQQAVHAHDLRLSQSQSQDQFDFGSAPPGSVLQAAPMDGSQPYMLYLQDSLPPVSQLKVAPLDPSSTPIARAAAMHSLLLPPKQEAPEPPAGPKPLHPSLRKPEHRHSKATRRGPMDEMRQLMRILVKIIPESVKYLATPEEGGGGNRVSEEQIKDYLTQTLGDAPAPEWGVPQGWGHYLSVLFTWALDREITREEAMRTARRQPGRSWEAVDEALDKLGIYSYNWPLPLTQEGCMRAKRRSPQETVEAHRKPTHPPGQGSVRASGAKRQRSDDGEQQLLSVRSSSSLGQQQQAGMAPAGVPVGVAAAVAGDAVGPAATAAAVKRKKLAAKPSTGMSFGVNLRAMSEAECWTHAFQTIQEALLKKGTSPLEQLSHVILAREAVAQLMDIERATSAGQAGAAPAGAPITTLLPPVTVPGPSAATAAELVPGALQLLRMQDGTGGAMSLQTTNLTAVAVHPVYRQADQPMSRVLYVQPSGAVGGAESSAALVLQQLQGADRSVADEDGGPETRVHKPQARKLNRSALFHVSTGEEGLGSVGRRAMLGAQSTAQSGFAPYHLPAGTDGTTDDDADVADGGSGGGCSEEAPRSEENGVPWRTVASRQSLAAAATAAAREQAKDAAGGGGSIEARNRLYGLLDIAQKQADLAAASGNSTAQEQQQQVGEAVAEEAAAAIAAAQSAAQVYSNAAAGLSAGSLSSLQAAAAQLKQQQHHDVAAAAAGSSAAPASSIVASSNGGLQLLPQYTAAYTGGTIPAGSYLTIEGRTYFVAHQAQPAGWSGGTAAER